MNNSDALDLNKIVPSGEKRMNIALLVAIGALCLQTCLVIVDRRMLHWNIWDDWTIQASDPLTFGLIILLGFIYFAAYLLFSVELYRLTRHKIYKGIFFASVVFAAALPIVSFLHLIRIPMDLSRFVTVIAIGFGAIIAYRVLIVFSLSKILFVTAKRLMLLLAFLMTACMILLLAIHVADFSIPPIAGYNPLVELGITVYFLNQPSPIDFVLTNVILVVDLIAFSAIMLFTFWNAPRRLAVSDESVSSAYEA